MLNHHGLRDIFKEACALETVLQEEAGQDVDVSEMARAVVDLIRSTGCSHCLVWSKNDELVRQVQSLRPGQPCGFIVAADLGLGIDSSGHVLPKNLRPDCRVCKPRLHILINAVLSWKSAPAGYDIPCKCAHASLHNLWTWVSLPYCLKPRCAHKSQPPVMPSLRCMHTSDDLAKSEVDTRQPIQHRSRLSLAADSSRHVHCMGCRLLACTMQWLPKRACRRCMSMSNLCMPGLRTPFQ